MWNIPSIQITLVSSAVSCVRELSVRSDGYIYVYENACKGYGEEEGGFLPLRSGGVIKNSLYVCM